MPLFLGMMIYAHTRKRELVDTFFQLGLSVSYDRVMDISMGSSTAAASQYQSDGVSSYEMVFSQLLQLIILTTIPARTRLRMHFMAQEYHYSKTEKNNLMVSREKELSYHAYNQELQTRRHHNYRNPTQI